MTSSKFAVIEISEFKLKVIGLSVEPFDHELNVYPIFGVAVMLTCFPCENVPPIVDTLPPSPAVTDKVYCLISCAGGVFGACESSLAQVRSNNRLI